MLRPLYIAAIFFGAATTADAALLVPVEGTVLVSRGDGFAEAAEVVEVKTGDRVLVRGEGRAQIDYGDGCLIDVTAKHSAVVGDTSGCDKTALYSAASTSGGPAATGSLKDGSLKDKPLALAPQDTERDYGLLVVGGVLAAGGVAALANNDDDKKPASP